MNNTTPKIEIIIATNHSLVGIGLQSLIGELGIDANFLVYNNLTSTNFKDFSENSYFIIHHTILPIPKQKSIVNIENSFKGQILVIGGLNMDCNFFEPIILPHYSKSEILLILESFFNINKIDNSESNVLSSREIDILKEVALGYPNKEIADRLFISINTVITHRKNLTEKLGIKTISGLTVYALMNKLINPEDVTL